jgi:hypothetical protein
MVRFARNDIEHRKRIKNVSVANIHSVAVPEQNYTHAWFLTLLCIGGHRSF